MVATQKVTVGTLVKSLRYDKKITQEKLAKRSGITRGYVSNIENDWAEPSDNTLRKMIRVLT